MKLRVAMSMLVLAGALFNNQRAGATTLVSMSLEQLTEASSDIVQASVVNRVCAWNSDHSQVLTITTAAVNQSYKGSAASTVEIEQLGGVIGNMHVFVPGDITLQNDSQYVLFLEPITGSSRFHLVGMTQGAYRVYEEASTHEDRLILPAFSQLPAQIHSLTTTGPAGTVPLVGFHKYVSNLVSAGIVVPHGVVMPVSIVSARANGSGRMHVYGKTTKDLFPSRTSVIPNGSEVEGEAVLNSAMWTIHWDEIRVRGVHAQISATNQESEGSLRGRSVLLQVR